MTTTADEKLSYITNRVLMMAVAIIFSITGIMYNDAKTRISTLEDRVSFLYVDKVSRAEFKEEMNQLRMQNDANKSDIISRQESLKGDILARIDLIIPHMKGK